jgi:hypothetical protein
MDVTSLHISAILDSHGGDYKDGCFLGCLRSVVRWKCTEVSDMLTGFFVRTSETSANYQTIFRNYPGDSHLQVRL